MTKVQEIILKEAYDNGLDPVFVMAIAEVESNYNPWACRFEKNWKYLLDEKQWAIRLSQSEETEVVQQSTSWGALQIMGTVAREYGFQGHLSQLSTAELGIKYGCKKLSALWSKYKNEPDAIAAYNAGSPKKDGRGIYSNQAYVDKVTTVLARLRQTSLG